MRDMEKVRERRYWKTQYEVLKELYNEAKAVLDTDPTNPWQITRVKNLQVEYLEANDRYFELMEEEVEA